MRRIHVHVHDNAAFEAKHPRDEDGHFAALHAAIKQHVARLAGEADDWARRKYKGNKVQVHLKGDGPTKVESLSIGTINARRRDANIHARNAQIDALERVGRVAKADPKVVVQQFNEAREVAEHMAKNAGWKFDEAFDVQLGKKFAGLEDSQHGPGSVGRAIREALEPHMKDLQKAAHKAPAAVSDPSDWMQELFGK